MNMSLKRRFWTWRSWRFVPLMLSNKCVYHIFSLIYVVFVCFLHTTTRKTPPLFGMNNNKLCSFFTLFEHSLLPHLVVFWDLIRTNTQWHPAERCDLSEGGSKAYPGWTYPNSTSICYVIKGREVIRGNKVIRPPNEDGDVLFNKRQHTQS